MKLMTTVLPMLVTAALIRPAFAEEITLHAPLFPERTTVKVDFVGTERAPAATLEAKVTYRDGQAQIEASYGSMKPAALFGGDVTAYVLWAVTRDGTTKNLGEVRAQSASGSDRFSTALKSFAMIVTAEPYYLVRRPSELLVFVSTAPDKKNVRSDSFTFAAFDEAPNHALESIDKVAWDSSEPLALVQAEKAYELAERIGAADYSPDILEQARVALAQARNLRKKKVMNDYALRSVALSNDAIGIAVRKIEAAELEAEIDRRRAEMEGLEARADEAEVSLASARDETAALAEERAGLESAMSALRIEQAALVAAVATLTGEKDELSVRLEDALSLVADTTSTARGMIVNLPDILFGVNESTLKPEAKLVIAKLAGILLIMNDLNLRIEGHTDATGSRDYNETLSEARARSVYDFLSGEGIAQARMISAGYGPDRPIADNETREGRSRNRRVEIVIAEGEVAEQ